MTNATVPKANGTRAPILAIDDDGDLVDLVRITLERDGHLVESAHSCAEALASAAQRRPALVILDLGLPAPGGEALARDLRAAHGDALPILVLSAHEDLIQRAAHLRADGALAKPFEILDLLAAVRRLLPR
jgi:DNA-binding response OmpR family regulator